jgi:hypothetical protein
VKDCRRAPPCLKGVRGLQGATLYRSVSICFRLNGSSTFISEQINMFRTLKSLALTAVVATLSMPALADTFSLGNLSSSSPASRTHIFDLDEEGSFTDYYTFSINTTSTVSGTTTEDDGFIGLRWSFEILDIDISSIGLSRKSSSGNYASVGSDSTPERFSFASLVSGDYRLSVNGRITEREARNLPRGVEAPSYTLTASAAPIASPTPEASDLAMTVLGLAAVGFWSRRQNKKA